MWIVTSLAGVVLFTSWFWLGLVEEGARQDSGQAGQDYADALVNDFGITPVVVAHIAALGIVVATGVWSRRSNETGFIVPVLVCVASSVVGLLLSIPLTAPIPALP
ncbi:hypothetical protein [Microbacterium sp. CFBP 8794]|uniref:hypothetical protein n=1 Tax=Microbacterium sp. CFBP 8794 TaxID=2775269 RepID=UPI00177D943C|nr:hypothetical protein [Microbacterium sp. CFBP 8794]MBD8479723.1 hypothetical protein [Microbacterium sp. CFBP 8794]